MKFTDNPYYSPESCGLEIIASVDTADSYEYDMLVVWKKLDDETLWWDADAGCSCPVPFDPSDNGHDLLPITKDNYNEFEKALDNHCDSSTDFQRIKLKVKKHLK